jgi:alanine racemase
VSFPTWVEVNLDALEHNIAEIRRRIGVARRMLLVVKADAYGHGAPEVSRVAQDAGVDFLGVATVHEGMELRRAGIRLPIVILSPTLASEIDEILQHDLRASVSSFEYARVLSDRACALSLSAIVHVEVDTGMGRSGVDETEAPALLQRVNALPNVTLEGVFTHFPDCAPGQTSFAEGQLARFLALVGETRAAGVAVPLAHAANTAGLLALPQSSLDMVRPGLMAYGHTHTGIGLVENLQPVMALKSRIVLLRPTPPGRSISYDRTFTTTRESRIAVIAAGYGHGLSLQLSNRGRVLVRGREAPIVGRVTMDMTMLDVTDIPGVEVGDEVVIFGAQDGARISLEEVARQSETLSYDVMISIGKRVPRVYLRHSIPTMVKTLVGRQ